MVNIIIGIDPGLKGSMAFLKTEGSLTIERLPVITEQRKTRRVRSIDTAALVALIKKHTAPSTPDRPHTTPSTPDRPHTGSSTPDQNPINSDTGSSKPSAIAIVEDVFSMPRDSRRGAFTFGGVKASITSALALCGVRAVFVSPAVWKGRMRLSADKKRSRALAEKLFPSTKFKSIDDCEAALLAGYLLLHMSDVLQPAE